MWFVPLLALNVMFASWICCSGLPVTDLEQLLDKDWSAIEESTALHAVSGSSQRDAAVHEMDANDDELDRFIASFRSRQQHHSFRTILPRPSTLAQQAEVEKLLNKVERIEVSAPTSLAPFSQAYRRQELEGLIARIYQLRTTLSKERKTLPLVVKNLSPEIYSSWYEQYLSPPDKQRFIWVLPDAIYMFNKPVKEVQLFQALFGTSELDDGQYWAVWKLQKHGQANIWRLLGIQEMPSHVPTTKFMKEHMLEQPKDRLRPAVFFNDASHLDSSQNAVRFL